MNDTHTITIKRNVADSYKTQIASIYYEAFQRKLLPLKGLSYDDTIDLLSEAIDTQQVFVAMRGERILGILGFHHNGKQFLDVTWQMLVTRFGWWQAIPRAFWGILLSRSKRSALDLQMDGIAVHPEARGQGVGTVLFDALFLFAQEKGYQYVWLDVVDTNARAQQLYERIGFEAITQERVPFSKQLGFVAVTTMRYEVLNQ